MVDLRRPRELVEEFQLGGNVWKNVVARYGGGEVLVNV